MKSTRNTIRLAVTNRLCFLLLLLKRLEHGCPTYGPRARIQPTRCFHPARKTYEAYWHSITWEVPGAAIKYQMKLTDIQNVSDFKRAFSEQGLLSFDSGYVSSDSYPNLPQDTKNFTALFGSTYCCEQLFWKWKTQKRNQGLCLQMNIWQHHCISRLQLLEQIYGHRPADIDYLCKQIQCQISH